jgi:hypothetical protein
MNWLCIDPGISGTGWAEFKSSKLVGWGIERSNKLTWQERAREIMIRMEQRAKNAEKVFCEWPTGRFSGAAGLAASNTDALLKLCFLIGALEVACGSLTLVSVQTWKGQLPKEIVQKRAERFFKTTGFKSHAADAVGIGQFVIESALLTLAK